MTASPPRVAMRPTVGSSLTPNTVGSEPRNRPGATSVTVTVSVSCGAPTGPLRTVTVKSAVPAGRSPSATSTVMGWPGAGTSSVIVPFAPPVMVPAAVAVPGEPSARRASP